MDSQGLTQLIAKRSQSIHRVDGGHNNNDQHTTRIQLAGRIRVQSPHRIVEERLLYGRQARLIFAMLVMERVRPIHRDELADALWPHGLPRSWDAALRGVVGKVRAFLSSAGLPKGVKLSVGCGAYQLHLPSDAVVDIEYARFAVDTAERMLCGDDPHRAVIFAEDARVIAIRPFLRDAKGCWVEHMRDQLNRVLLSALCVLSEGYAQRGQYQLAIRTAEDAIELEPFRERTHQLLMRVHAAAGNRAEALRAYDRCRRILAAELGVYPTAETAALHLALLQNE